MMINIKIIEYGRTQKFFFMSQCEKKSEERNAEIVVAQSG